MRKSVSAISILLVASLISGCSEAQQDDAGTPVIAFPTSPQSTQIAGTSVAPSNVLAQKNGIVLTKRHLEMSNAIEAALDGEAYTAAELIEEFTDDPNVVAEIEETYREIIEEDYLAEVPASIPGQLPAPGASPTYTPPTPTPATAPTNGQGHLQLRQLLGAPEQYFNNAQASQLRTFLSNTQFGTGSSSQYGTSDHHYTLCSGGTFIYRHEGSFSVVSEIGDVRDVDVGAVSEGMAVGVWDTVSQNGTVSLVMYSPHRAFVELSDAGNGFEQLPVASYQGNNIAFGIAGLAEVPSAITRFPSCQ